MVNGKELNKDYGWRNVWSGITSGYIRYCFKRGSLYYKLNRELFFFVFPFIKHTKQVRELAILDLGCGPGNTIYFFGKKIKKAKFVGVDKEKGFIDFAKFFLKNKGINVGLYCKTAENFLKSCKEKFDLVTANSCLWHMNTEQVFRHIKRILKEGGVFAFNLAPHVIGEKMKYNAEKALDLISLREAKKMNIPYKFHSLQKEIKIGELCAKNNLKIVKQKKIKIIQNKSDFFEFFNKLIILRTWKKRYPNLGKSKAINLLKKNVKEVYKKINENGKVLWLWEFYVVKKR